MWLSLFPIEKLAYPVSLMWYVLIVSPNPWKPHTHVCAHTHTCTHTHAHVHWLILFMFSFAPSISATPHSSSFQHRHSRNPVQRVKALPSVNGMPNHFTLPPERDLDMNAAGLAHSDPVFPLAFSTSVFIHALHCYRQGQTGVGTKMCPVLAPSCPLDLS